MLQFHIGILFPDFGRDLTPQAGRFEHVGLVHGCYFLLANFRQPKGQLHDALDFVIVVFERINGTFAAIFDIAAFRPAEIQASGQFTHDHDIHTSQFLCLEG